MKDSGARSKSSLPWSRNFLLGLFVVLLACGKGCQCSSSAPPDRAPRFVTSKKSQGGTEAQVAQPGTEHGGTETQAGQPGTEEEGVATVGHKLYVQHCAACHGEKGDGKGLAAAYLFPKPRDFSSGFRLVSTNNATPSPADVEAVLTRGMPGSAMPPWAHLSAQDRAALAEEVLRLRGSLIRSNYIQRLKDDGETDEYIAEADTQEEIGEIVVSMTTPGETSKVPDLGEQTAEAVARGKAIYIKQGCKSCHGDTGKGDGQQKMVDNEGLPTSPRDLTKGIFKGGHDPASVYRRVAYGMPGTPMPSSKNLDSKQIADLVHFSLSLSNEAARESVILKRERIVANQVAAVPVALDATAWSEAPSVGIRMTPLWWRDDADPGLKVQALHDGESVALRLVWSDPNANEHAAKTESFEDALAVELYRGDSEPFIGMGGKGAAVDVWMWDADRQGSPTAIEEIYPNIVTDRFPFSEVVASAEGKRPAALTANQPKISLPAVASGNQIVPVEGPSGATSLTVGGPGSVTFRLPTSQLVKARGEWKDGRWTVVMTRVLATMSESDGISLKPGDRVSVAFAVWEGSMRDRDGKKVISVWQDLELGKAK